MKNDVLKALKHTTEYISGESLSKSLGVSRAAVWKAIKSLRTDGYIIDSVTNKGYLLQRSPDLLSELEIAEYLHTKTLGKRIISLSEVDSTNRYLKKSALEGAEHGLAVISEMQTDGKGRLQRNWQSNQGIGIYLSVLLRPYVPPSDIAAVTQLSGLAVCKAINGFADVNAKIKWPNDILINGKKVCGILTETSSQADMVDFIVIGIGINVNNEFFGDDLSEKATSLFLSTGQKQNRAKLAATILNKLEQMLANGFLLNDDSLLEYKSLCSTINQNVLAVCGNETISGKAVDINSRGELILLQGKEMRCISCGEINTFAITKEYS
ncbi:MAG: biotin--[acetyl-CoA-carboxylase] ligase [Bacillota bacterium]|nr:biotin--[acetyl-CoA-carboxylase] ligase [Bacillota bacterium]